MHRTILPYSTTAFYSPSITLYLRRLAEAPRHLPAYTFVVFTVDS